jgi:predicted AAA+ superfamily ATPase
LGLSSWETIGKGTGRPAFIPDSLIFGRDDRELLSLKDLYTLIWRGSFPALTLDSDMNRDLFMASYVQTYLERDVLALASVGDGNAFYRFLRSCAARTGQLLNIADMSRDADISPVTGKQWLSILVASGIVYLLEPYYSNVTKRMVKAPKLYFLDTGLASYLTGWPSPETLEAGAMSGAIFETWVLGEILKSWLNNGLTPPLHYYRDKDKKEIDFLLIREGAIYPVECKKTASPGKDDVRHFQVLDKLNMPIGTGCVICLAGQSLPLTEKTWAVPVSLI